MVNGSIRNVGLASVLILTISNMLLTLRLLQSDCHLPFPPHMNTVPNSPLPILNTTITETSHNSSSPSLPVNLHLGRWDQKRHFKMFDSVITGDAYIDFSGRYRVSLASQCSVEKLYSLIEVAQQWAGPISVALYAAGNIEYAILQGSINYLRRCFKPIRERVNFHLLFPGNNLPVAETAPEASDHLNCGRPEKSFEELLAKRTPQTMKWRQDNLYPQNHMRNLARKNCQTPYVFLTDIDIIPSRHMADQLNSFLQASHCASGKCAYVIPTYEIDDSVKFPKNKSELVNLAHKKLAQPFHRKLFFYNQGATNFTRWEKDANESALHVSYDVKFEFFYEPFYVALDTAPPHDERFLGYGFTRNTQTYEMDLAGFVFQVLSPVFACQWGLQTKKNPTWRDQQTKMNYKKFGKFKQELEVRYHNV